MSAQNSYFPIFLSLDNKKILIVGGGTIAKDKLTRLLDFTKDISLISKDFSYEIMQVIEKNSLDFRKKEYEEDDIKGFDIAVVAVDDIELQKNIYNYTRDKNILVNSVDNKNYCDFIFGSYIKKDDLVIAISTSGSSPSVAKYLRIFLEKTLPKNISSFLKEVKQIREDFPKGKERMKLLDSKVKSFFDSL